MAERHYPDLFKRGALEIWDDRVCDWEIADKDDHLDVRSDRPGYIFRRTGLGTIDGAKFAEYLYALGQGELPDPTPVV